MARKDRDEREQEKEPRIERCVQDFGIGVASDDRDMFSSRLRLRFPVGCELEVIHETASSKTVRVPLVSGIDMTVEVPKINLK